MTDSAPFRPQRRCACVDIHTHVVPLDFPAYAGQGRDVPWPSMAASPTCGHRNVMVSGRVYRTVTSQCWDASERLADMDRLGIERQVLSPMPELLSYWMSAADGTAICRFLNETIAAMVASAPGRFDGLAAVPLQDVEAGIRELEHAVRELGLAGVELGSNINGKPIGHADFAPFFEAAARLGAAVFVHPLRPVGMDRLVGPAPLEQVVAFPGEIGLAAASMITGGTMARLRDLRIAFSHGAGSLQIVVARLQHAWSGSAPLQKAMSLSPIETARLMYYDDLFYDNGAIQRLIEVVGETQVMVGSDYPFAIADQDPAGRVETLAVSDSVREKVLRENALRWLGRSVAH